MLVVTVIDDGRGRRRAKADPMDHARAESTSTAAPSGSTDSPPSTARRARTLRETIFGVFSAAARRAAPSPAALGVLNEHLRVLGHLRLARGGSAYRWFWEDEGGDVLDRPLWPVVRSAAELLTSDRLDRVRRCSADECDWLFLDRSKNGSRRWCDMTVCGNRSKVRRFRQAQQES